VAKKVSLLDYEVDLKNIYMWKIKHVRWLDLTFFLLLLILVSGLTCVYFN